MRVRKHGASEKWVAEVLYINHACDLALLTVADSAFWQVTARASTQRHRLTQNLPALEIARDMPEVYDNVMVIGYPMGGDNICVTRSDACSGSTDSSLCSGIVSRVTTMSYEQVGLCQCTPSLMRRSAARTLCNRS